MFKRSCDNSDSSEAITMQSLIFRKPKNSDHVVNHLNKMT